MNHVSVGGEMDSVDAGPRIQLENTAVGREVFVNMSVNLFSQIPQNNVRPVCFVVAKRLLAESRVYDFRLRCSAIFN